MSSHVIGPLLCGGLLALAATTGALAQSATGNPKPVLPKAGPHSITAPYVGDANYGRRGPAVQRRRGGVYIAAGDVDGDGRADLRKPAPGKGASARTYFVGSANGGVWKQPKKSSGSFKIMENESPRPVDRIGRRITAPTR